MKRTNLFQSIVVIGSGIFLVSGYTLLYVFTRDEKIPHAVIGMGAGLIVFWVVLLGGAMFLFREPVKKFVQKIPLHWQVKFIVFCILLAMLEEAIAVTMTNLAPWFGVGVGEAYITASANYFDVIVHHSVIVFVPWFIVWAWLLKRYLFNPFQASLLFGLNGLIGESIAFGAQNPLSIVMWMFIYGLMIYLPSYTLPEERGAKPPNLWHGVLAFLFPLAAGILWAVIINIFQPGHPDIHFPLLQI